MGKSRSRLAADWFAKLRVNAITQEVEHEDVVAEQEAIAAAEAKIASDIVTAKALADSEMATAIAGATMASSDILTSLKTVDGSGSGLDADTVDGIHASGLARMAISTYDQLLPSQGTWLRAPSSGFLPSADNAGALGTSSWKFSSAYISTVYGNLSGNATTATKLATARTINGVSFNGSANITVPTGVPSGVITMWSGLISAIPATWFLCNGANGTPDLRGRFIYGASVDGDVGVTGGSANAIVVSHTHSTPAHTHTASSNTTGAHTHSFYDKSLTVGGGGFYTNYHATYHAGVTAITGSSGNHSHTITVNSGGGGTSGSTGSSGTNANLPPYMKLAYIMKG